MNLTNRNQKETCGECYGLPVSLPASEARITRGDSTIGFPPADGTAAVLGVCLWAACRAELDLPLGSSSLSGAFD